MLHSGSSEVGLFKRLGVPGDPIITTNGDGSFSIVPKYLALLKF